MNKFLDYAMGLFIRLKTIADWVKADPRNGLAIVVLVILIIIGLGFGTAEASHEGTDQGQPVETFRGNQDYYSGVLLIRTDFDKDGTVDMITFCMPPPPGSDMFTACIEVHQPKWDSSCRLTLKADGFYLCGKAAEDYVPNAQGA